MGFFNFYLCRKTQREKSWEKEFGHLAFWITIGCLFSSVILSLSTYKPTIPQPQTTPPPPSFSFFIYSNFASLFSVGLVLLFGLFGFLLFLFFSSSLCFLSPRNWCFSDKDQRTLFMLFFNLCALRKKQSTS